MDQPSEAQPTPTTLYRLYDAQGTLLYIGIAGNPGRRFEQHRCDKPWWGDVSHIKLEHFPTRQDAEAIELAAIRDEGPPYNLNHSAATKRKNRNARRLEELMPGGQRAVDVAAEMGVSRNLYTQRRNDGWSIERAATTRARAWSHASREPGDTWGEWTVVSRNVNSFVLRHVCGHERRAGAHQLDGPLNCMPCWRKDQGQVTPEEKELARNEKEEARHREHPIGATRNGWTIVAYRGVQARGLLIRAQHLCGAELDTTAGRISGGKPPKCACMA